MNRILEMLLTVLALAALYCAIPTASQSHNSSVRAGQVVTIADGSDPMPLCRKKNCSQ